MLLEAGNATLAGTVAAQQEQIAALKQQVVTLSRMLFGRSGEKGSGGKAAADGGEDGGRGAGGRGCSRPSPGTAAGVGGARKASLRSSGC